MAVDVPAIVIEDGAVRSLSTLTTTEARAARAFRDAKGWSLVDAPTAPKSKPIAADPTHAARIARIEATLHAARGPLELGDREALPALRSELATAYGEARAHPEDPEAALLVAELLRTMARAEALAGDDEAAAALRARATLLDGGRKIGLSEGGDAEAKTTPHTVSLAIEGAAGVLVDDAPVKGSSVALADGEHHVRLVDENGATLLARFVAIGKDTTTVALTVPREILACDAAELARAARDAKFKTSCARWAIVRRGQAALSVQLCGPSSCESPTHWAYDAQKKPKTTPPPSGESILRSPWTWVAVGAAAVAGGAIAAWRLGAFDRPEAPPPTWRWEGAK